MKGGILLNRSRQVPAEDTAAFGGIAERFRRAGDLERAIALCREGLRKFPTLLSARVTLGWALLDKGDYDEARAELEQVLRRAPDNLAAIRGLAELHDRTDHLTGMDEDAGWHQAQADLHQAQAAEVAAAHVAEVPAARETVSVDPPPPVPAPPVPAVSHEASSPHFELIGASGQPVVPFMLESAGPVTDLTTAPAGHGALSPFEVGHEAVVDEFIAPPISEPFEPEPAVAAAAMSSGPDLSESGTWLLADLAAAPAAISDEVVTLPASEAIALEDLAGSFAAEPVEPVHDIVFELPAMDAAAPGAALDLDVAPFESGSFEVEHVPQVADSMAAVAAIESVATTTPAPVLQSAAPMPVVAAPVDLPRDLVFEPHGLSDFQAVPQAVAPMAAEIVETPPPAPAAPLRFEGAVPAAPATIEAPVGLPDFAPVLVMPRAKVRPPALAGLERMLRKIEGHRLELASGSMA